MQTQLCPLMAQHLKNSCLQGHSLGGALSTLAAHDFATTARKHAAESNVVVSCWTFGSPRTGNNAWAREAMDLYPSCWHLINDQV